MGSSTKKTKCASKARANANPKTTAPVDQAPQGKVGAVSIVKKSEYGCEFYQLRQNGQALVQLTLKMLPDPACSEAMRDLQRMAERGASKTELADKKKDLIKRWREDH